VGEVLLALEQELAEAGPGAGLGRAVRIPEVLESASDLETARKHFLPFSAAAVNFAKEARKENLRQPVKLYYCPMASKPGVWLQTKGPLRNPFFGSEMLSCGQEVRP
jgi:membrane fusion protein, copper/silver efflux system